LLGVARQRFVFFEQLRSIAARAIVDAVAHFGPSVLRALAILTAPAATATGLLTIVDQAVAVLNKGGVQIPFCPRAHCRIRTAGRSAASPNQSTIAWDRSILGVKKRRIRLKSWQMRSPLDGGISAVERSRQALFERNNQTTVSAGQIDAAIDR
jgi:hypothetical protein